MSARRIVLLLTVLGCAGGCEASHVERPEPISYANPGGGGGGGGLPDGDLTDPPPPGTPSTEGDFPRLAAFVGQLDKYSEAEKDTLARYELLSLRAAPEEVATLHARNPDARLFYRVSPQTVSGRDWEREWSWMDRVRRYSLANDWVLLHNDGSQAEARGWGEYWKWGDFTSYCPEGVFFDPAEPELDSRGLTLAEWLATRFIPWFVDTQMAGYEGLWWEVVADEPSRLWFFFDVSDPDGTRLDWNRNGIPDWSEGGWTEFDRFIASWKAVTTWWMDEVRRQLGPDFPIIAGGDAHAPPLSYFQGFKNEDFLNRNRWSGAQWTWWDEFYTHTADRPRRGYRYQRDHALDTWRLSINQIFWYDNVYWQFSNPTAMRRYVRFALATTLLGDGLFCFYDLENPNPEGQPRNPWVAEYYDIDLGTYAYPMQRYVVGADTVYTRHFHDGEGHLTGFVAVNPNPISLAGIGPEDAVITTY